MATTRSAYLVLSSWFRRSLTARVSHGPSSTRWPGFDVPMFLVLACQNASNSRYLELDNTCGGNIQNLDAWHYNNPYLEAPLWRESCNRMEKKTAPLERCAPASTSGPREKAGNTSSSARVIPEGERRWRSAALMVRSKSSKAMLKFIVHHQKSAINCGKKAERCQQLAEWYGTRKTRADPVQLENEEVSELRPIRKSRGLNLVNAG